MEYEIQAGITKEIDFAPASIAAEVLQNVRTIISTPKYSVPLNRELGMTMTYLDAPMPISEAKLIAEIFTEVPRWEPRAVVTQVTFVEDNYNGVLVPKVRVSINE